MEGGQVRAVLQTINSSGSGFGVSYWSRWMGCPAKAHYAETSNIKGKPKKALVLGSVAHGLLELYYKLAMKSVNRALALNTTAVSFVDDAGDPADVKEDARLEGERIFRAYRLTYPPDEFGTILAVERLYKDVGKAVICKPFSFKPDMELNLSKAEAKSLFKSRRIKVDKGYWLVDHKTDGGFPWSDQAFMDAVQFAAYCMEWQEFFPDRELNGLLVNVLPKTKNPEFRTLVYPYPSKKKQEIAKNFLAQAQERRAGAYASGVAKANIAHCYTYGPCDYLPICDRAA